MYTIRLCYKSQGHTYVIISVEKNNIHDIAQFVKLFRKHDDYEAGKHYIEVIENIDIDKSKG